MGIPSATARRETAEAGSSSDRRGRWARARAAGLFLGLWAALNITVNDRFPAPEVFWWSLLPAPEVTALGMLLALYGRSARRFPNAGMAASVAALVLVRLFRIADGVGVRYFNRPLNLDLDLRLLPELGRLLRETVSAWILLAGIVGAIAILFGVGFLAWRALRYGERFLADAKQRRWAAIAVALLLASSIAGAGAAGNGRSRGPRHSHSHSHTHWGAFAPSVAPRLWREGAFYLRRGTYRENLRQAMDANQRRLTAGAHDLAGLHGADLFLFLIESYGMTVNQTDEHRRLIAPAYAAFESTLGKNGFSIATGTLDSPTYAGRSWLAQATLTTGVRTEDSIGFGLLQERRPPALPTFLRLAGYRTIFVQPGTTTPWPERWSYDVDRTYSAWELDYRGPPFRWASMPDQYVIDFVHRREVAPPHRPLFAAYALVSSHAPWSDQPRVVDDWEALDQGRIYTQLPVVHFPMSWLNLRQAGPAYLSSVIYDLEVLRRYILEKVPGDALVIVLGDHQPVGDVTGHDPSSAVPVHVISRNRTFVETFIRELGYRNGMRPDSTRTAPGMETFLPGFLRAFSTPAPAAGP